MWKRRGDFNSLSFMLIKEDEILVFIIHSAQFSSYVIQEMAIQHRSTTDFDFLHSEHRDVGANLFVFVIFFHVQMECLNGRSSLVYFSLLPLSHLTRLHLH